MLEPGLWASWGGSPSVRRLRWRDAPDEERVRRLHVRLDNLLEEPLPDAESEALDPDAADARYEEAIAVLRERTRDTSRFRLVFAENMEYGFRRNSLGLRPIGLAIALIAFAVSIVFFVWGGGSGAGRATRWGISGGIAVLLAFYWRRVVTPQWVRVAAEVYAERLLEAVETLRADRRA